LTRKLVGVFFVFRAPLPSAIKGYNLLLIDDKRWGLPSDQNEQPFFLQMLFAISYVNSSTKPRMEYIARNMSHEGIH
jgi:hypothetical protein